MKTCYKCGKELPDHLVGMECEDGCDSDGDMPPTLFLRAPTEEELEESRSHAHELDPSTLKTVEDLATVLSEMVWVIDDRTPLYDKLKKYLRKKDYSNGEDGYE